MLGLTIAQRGVNKPTTQMTSHAHDFTNAKSRARKRPLLVLKPVKKGVDDVSWFAMTAELKK